MTATALTESEVRALYPSSAAQNQFDLNTWKHLGQQKPTRRLVQGERSAASRR